MTGRIVTPVFAKEPLADWQEEQRQELDREVARVGADATHGSPSPVPTDRRTSWTADELMAEVFPPPRWAVPGLLAEGLNLLAGSPKLGKSWLALGLAVAVAAGGRALGSAEVEEGDVLTLCLEDTGRRLQDRLRAVLQGDRAPARLTVSTECPPFHDGGRDRVAAWLDQHPKARLVVVDTFAKVRGTSAKGDDRYQADYAATAAVKALADDYGVSFLLVHHVRKAVAEDFTDAVSGSNGIAGAADAILVLRRSRGSSDATLEITGRDVEEAKHALAFDTTTGAWRLLDGHAEDYEVGDTRRRILQLLRDEEGMTPKAVADALDLDDANARQTLSRMAKAGQIDTDGAGHYFVPVTPVALSLLERDQ